MNSSAAPGNRSGITAKAIIGIDATPAEVYDALVNPAKIKKYFFGTDAQSDWKVGSPLKFTGEYEGKTYEDKGTILANEPGKQLQYSYWSSMSGIEDKPENYVTVTNTITEKDGKTLLEITQENVPTEEMRQHSEQNWNKVLHGLKDLVEGKA